MSDALGPFLSLYEERVDHAISKVTSNLDKWSARLETYNALYPEVLKTATELGIVETFQKLYPEGGGSPDIFTDAIESSNLYSYGEDILPIKALDKVADSPQRVERLTNRLDEVNAWKGGGEDYLKKLSSAFISLVVPTTNPQKSLEKFTSDYESYEYVADRRISDVITDGPTRVKGSVEAYTLIKEKVDSGELKIESDKTEEPTTDVINPEETAKTEGDESLAINSDAEPDTLDENTTLDESSIDAETVGTDVKTTQEALSLPEEVETTGPINQEVETTSPINQEVELEKPVEENIETEPGPLNDIESSQEAFTQDLETSQSPITQPDQAPVEQVEAQLQTIPEAESPIAVEPTVSPIGNEEPKKTSLFKRLKKSLSQGGGAISNISNILNSATTFLQDGSISNLISNIGDKSNVESNTINQLEGLPGKIKDQITSKKDEALAKESSVSNVSETFLNQDLSKTGDIVKNTSLGGAVSNIVDKSSSFSSFPKSEIIKPEPITKADISEVGESISTNVSSSITASPQAQEFTSDSIEISSGKERRKAMREDRQEKRDEKKAARGMVSTNNDFSSLEKRLKNIELLLMGPLEVKIKN